MQMRRGFHTVSRLEHGSLSDPSGSTPGPAAIVRRKRLPSHASSNGRSCVSRLRFAVCSLPPSRTCPRRARPHFLLPVSSCDRLMAERLVQLRNSRSRLTLAVPGGNNPPFPQVPRALSSAFPSRLWRFSADTRVTDPFVAQLAELSRAHVTPAKWVFVQSHGVGRTIGESNALAGTNGLNLRFATLLEVALRMGAPFLVELGIDPSEEGLGPALIMRLLLDLSLDSGDFRPLAGQLRMAGALRDRARDADGAREGERLKTESFASRALGFEIVDAQGPGLGEFEVAWPDRNVGVTLTPDEELWPETWQVWTAANAMSAPAALGQALGSRVGDDAT